VAVHRWQRTLSREGQGRAARLAQQALLACRAGEGQLQARLQGRDPMRDELGRRVQQCRGGLRPGGDVIRLIYKGIDTGEGTVLVVIGRGTPSPPDQSTHNVPVNLTSCARARAGLRDQGDDKCALDEVAPRNRRAIRRSIDSRAAAIARSPLAAIGGDGAVLVSRFDVQAIVDLQMNTTRPVAAALLLLSNLLASLAGATGPGDSIIPLSAFPREPIVVETRSARRHTFEAWRAETDAARAQGLMFVRDIRPDRGDGSSSTRPRTQMVAMWMKNTLLPLDMLFVDAGPAAW